MGQAGSKLTHSYVQVPRKSNRDDLKTIPECLEYFSLEKPKADAVIFASTNGSRQAVRWKELYNKSRDVAKRFINLGIKRYEFVAINLHPCPEWLFLTFGAIMAGAIPISIVFTYTDGSDVIAMMKKLGKCSTIVVDPGENNDNWTIFSQILDEYSNDGSIKANKMPCLRYMLCHERPCGINNVKTLDEFLCDDVADVELPQIDQDDVVTLFQTSGSTGVPKAVAHTHRSLMTLRRCCNYDCLNADDILFNDRPFGWIGGYPIGVMLGQTRVTVSGKCPPPEDKLKFVIDVINTEKCTAMGALPQQLHELIKRKDEIGDNWPLKSIITGGQPITRELAKYVGIICKYFVSVYAGTEFSFASALCVDDSQAFADYACGYVINGIEMKIVDEKGEIVPVNTRGDVYIRTDGMFKEYFSDPDKTKAAKTEDGWYKTDDIGKLNEDSLLYILGRKSNMIISGGMNVTPEIQETVIKSCPGVDLAVIVPIPDKVFYQVICACVILKTGSTTTKKEIREFVEEMHNDKPGLFTVLPMHYIILDSIPETHTGKLSRTTLTEMARKMLKV